MRFKLLTKLEAVETIAAGRSVDARAYLTRRYGPARWRKMKGKARIELEDGRIGWAELHWYEAHGMGQVDMKFKRALEPML